MADDVSNDETNHAARDNCERCNDELAEGATEAIFGTEHAFARQSIVDSYNSVGRERR